MWPYWAWRIQLQVNIFDDRRTQDRDKKFSVCGRESEPFESHDGKFGESVNSGTLKADRLKTAEAEHKVTSTNVSNVCVDRNECSGMKTVDAEGGNPMKDPSINAKSRSTSVHDACKEKHVRQKKGRKMEKLYEEPFGEPCDVDSGQEIETYGIS